MTFLPIVERELRVAARRRASFWLRMVAAGVFVVMGMIALSAASLSGTAASGRGLFRTLAGFCWLCCVAAGPMLVADTLAAERRQNTLGLLFLTDLRPVSIVLGKAAAAILRALSVVLASVPVFSIAVFLGGVTGGQIIAVFLALGATLLFSIGVTLAVSAGCRDSRSAFALSAFLVVCFTLLLPGMSAILSLASPGRLMELALMTGIGTGDFAARLIVVQALAWGSIGLAAWILKAVSHDRPRASAADRGFRSASAWLYGRGPARQRLRRRLLDQNPWAWLAGRNVLKRRFLLVIFVPLLPLWMLFGWPNDQDLTLTVIWLIQFLLKVLVTSESCHQFVIARREGAFELLLSTPLNPRDIIRGQRRAVHRLFDGPVLVTAILANALLLPHFTGWDKLIPPLVTLIYFTDFTTLTTLSLWRGLAAKRAHLVVPGVLLRVLFWPSLMVGFMLPGMQAGPTSPWIVLALWSMIFGMSNFAQHNFAKDMLKSDLRPKLAGQFLDGRRSG